MWAVLPIQESIFLNIINYITYESRMLKFTSSLKSSLLLRFPSKLCAILIYIFPNFAADPTVSKAYLHIWMRAESNGTYLSWYEQHKTMF